MLSAPPVTNLILLPNQAVPMPTFNKYANLYSSNSYDNPVFEEMVINDKTSNSINTYYVVLLNSTLANTTTKVLKKLRNIIYRTQLATIKRARSDTTASARLLLNALLSISQAIIHAHTDKIALYKNSDKA